MTEPDSTSITYGLCHCGCGQPTNVPKQSSARDGAVKGVPMQYVRGHNSYHSTPLYIEEDRGYETPCWIWQRSFNTQGHAQITVNKKSVLAHRFLYEKEYGPVERGLHLHHKCRQRDCIRLSHLEPLTPARHSRTHKSAKIDVETAFEIRRLYTKGDTSYEKLAKQYNVAPMTIWRAVNGPLE